jgi:hypothetical protein
MKCGKMTQTHPQKIIEGDAEPHRIPADRELDVPSVPKIPQDSGWKEFHAEITKAVELLRQSTDEME